MNTINYIKNNYASIFTAGINKAMPAISRINEIAKEVFYFFVFFARTKFEVTLVIDTRDFQYYSADINGLKRIIRNELSSYKWNVVIHKKSLSDINVQDCSGKRLLVKIIPGNCGIEALDGKTGTFIRDVQKDASIKLLTYVSENVHFRNPPNLVAKNQFIQFYSFSQDQFQKAIHQFVQG